MWRKPPASFSLHWGLGVSQSISLKALQQRLALLPTIITREQHICWPVPHPHGNNILRYYLRWSRQDRAVSCWGTVTWSPLTVKTKALSYILNHMTSNKVRDWFSMFFTFYIYNLHSKRGINLRRALKPTTKNVFLQLGEVQFIGQNTEPVNKATEQKMNIASTTSQTSQPRNLQNLGLESNLDWTTTNWWAAERKWIRLLKPIESRTNEIYEVVLIFKALFLVGATSATPQRAHTQF